MSDELSDNQKAALDSIVNAMAIRGVDSFEGLTIATQDGIILGTFEEAILELFQQDTNITLVIRRGDDRLCTIQPADDGTFKVVGIIPLIRDPDTNMLTGGIPARFLPGLQDRS